MLMEKTHLFARKIEERDSYWDSLHVSVKLLVDTNKEVRLFSLRWGGHFPKFYSCPLKPINQVWVPSILNPPEISFYWFEKTKNIIFHDVINFVFFQ